MSAMTVGDVVRTLLLDTPVHFDGMPTRDAVLQVTLDGETFYAIDQFIDYGDGGVVAQLMPWPPDSPIDFATQMQATQDDSLLERWDDPQWRAKLHDDLLDSIAPQPADDWQRTNFPGAPPVRCAVHGVTFIGEDDRCHWGTGAPGNCTYPLEPNWP